MTSAFNETIFGDGIHEFNGTKHHDPRFTLVEVDFLTSIQIVAGSLSLAGSLAIIISFIFGSGSGGNGRGCGATEAFSRKNIINRFVCYMAIADIISSAMYIVGDDGPLLGSESALCTAQAFLLLYGDMVSIFCTGTIATIVLLLCFMKMDVEAVERFEIVFCFINFGLVFIMYLVPIFIPRNDNPSSIYGAQQLYCWIDDYYPDVKLALFYIPLWTVFAYIVSTYATSAKQLWNDDDIYNKKSKYDYKWRVTFIIVAFILSWLFISIQRIYQFSDPAPSYVLALLTASTAPTRGFFNFIAYFVTGLLIV